MKRKLSLLLSLVIIFTSIFYQNPLPLFASGNGLEDVNANERGTEEQNGNTESEYISISEAEVEPIDDMVYTGQEVRPTPIIKYQDQILMYGVDYYLEHYNNIGIGTATVVVVGVGSYTGRIEIDYTITPIDISSSEVVIKPINDMNYTGEKIEPYPVITYQEKTLLWGVDYRLEYRNNIDVGTATIVITGMRNFMGIVEINFTINSQKMSISEAVVAPINDVTYTGYAINPSPVITYNEQVLVEGVDYQLEYSNNINVGTATIVITGIGDFIGKTEINFTINMKNLSILEAVVTPIDDISYTGQEVKPSPIITFDDQILIEGVDYRLEYRNNINVGTATIVVNGIGFFRGSREVSFTIRAIDLSSSEVKVNSIKDMTYTGKGIKPSPVVTYQGHTLVEGADYTLSYENNVHVGTATVEITGIGFFVGSIKADFTINPMPVSSLTLRALSSKLYTGTAITQNIVLKNGDAVLKEGIDFTVSYSDNINMSNSAKVIITGLGNYNGSRTDTFSIVSAGVYATIFEGEGTEENPYLISSPEDLKKLADKVNSEVYGQKYSFRDKYFVLTNDIDISGYENWTPIGTSGDFGTFSAFCGTINGQGYTISGLKITGDISGYQGLFGHLYGDISNLTVEGNINADAGNEAVHVGGICGENFGDITNCISKVNININSDRNISEYTEKTIGGISGRSFHPIINCINWGNISIDSIYAYAGGIVGGQGGNIIGCQNYGDISSPSDTAGGIACYNIDNMIGCYNVGKVTDSKVNESDSKLYDYNSGRIYGCYSGQEMQSQSTIDSVNEIFLKYKSVFPNEKYIYKYVADTENINNGYPILNLSIVTTVSAELSTSSGLTLDDCDINEATLPYGYSTVQELKEDMESMLLSTDSSINNIQYFDFVLRYTNGPNIGEIVTADNFPENGIDIRIPYPKGTDSDNYKFTILHIKQDGTNEFLNGRTLNDCILFHTDSLSPFAIGWKGENTVKSISDCSISTILPQQYTGDEIKPLVNIYSKGKLLSDDNYTLTYSENKNVGLAKITVEGKSEFTGTVIKTFEIVQASMDNVTITLDKESYSYNGTKIIPNMTITDGTRTLSENDYRVIYSGNENVGIAVITIEGKGNYTGSKDKTFSITALDISNMSISLNQEEYKYDGDVKTPFVTVKNGEESLWANVDYIVSYENNKNVGLAEVTITGQGNYSGQIKKTFSIVAKNISDVNIALEKTEYAYDGNAKTPSVMIKNGGITLVNGTDYITSYSNNVNVGLAEVTITGQGNYSGQVKKNFSIVAKNISDMNIALEKTKYTYDGKTKAPSVTIKNGGVTLVNGTDYAVSYKNNINAGTATVVITGNGNYSGSASKTFTIEKTGNTITSSNIVKTMSAKKQSFSINAKANHGVKLSYKSNNKNIAVTNTGKVTIAKNYVGEATITITLADTTNYKNTTKKIKITVNPTPVSITSLKNNSTKKMTIKWKRNKNVSGYQVSYATTSNFKKTSVVNIKSNKTLNRTISKLSKGKKYYVRIRTYKNVSGKTYYSSWSKSKSVKIAK